MPGTGLGILIHNCLMKHLLMRAGPRVLASVSGFGRNLRTLRNGELMRIITADKK